MGLEDIPQVLEVDRESYTLPWPASAYRREVANNPNARYYVLRSLPDVTPPDVAHVPADRPRPLPFIRWGRGDSGRSKPGQIVGYAGMWLMIEEAHITTIAVRTGWRGKGLGELLLSTLIEQAADLGADRVTLEVRVSNEVAQALYRKYRFEIAGKRLRYYSDNNEDAYIMTTGSIADAGYLENFEGLVSALEERMRSLPDAQVTSPVFGRAIVDEIAHEGP